MKEGRKAVKEKGKEATLKWEKKKYMEGMDEGER